MRFYSVYSMPGKAVDNSIIFECIGKRDFVLVYDLSKGVSFIGLDYDRTDKVIRLIENNIPGIGFNASEAEFSAKSGVSCFSAFRGMEKPGAGLFRDIFDIATEGFLAVAFIYSNARETESAKAYIEEALSSRNVREADTMQKGIFLSRANSTSHRELYHGSEERMMLGTLLGSLNDAVLGNGLAYKVFLLVPKDSGHLRGYVESRFLILDQYELSDGDVLNSLGFLSRRNAMPFGAGYAKEFLQFHGLHMVNRTLKTISPARVNGVQIGSFVKDGALDTDISVRIDPSAINLGFIVTGLPGSGKTREAMSVLDGVLGYAEIKPVVLVITPTDEWDGFALSHGMYLVRPFLDDTPINFFRCPTSTDVGRFYGDLAMILSSAANAGPYQGPIEKCLLNAFRYTYSKTRTPDPVSTYSNVEESVVRFHGKRTSAGVKYTKHGENIKSSLENLRGLLNMRQYCVADGIRIEELAKRGAVFNLSKVSEGMRSHLYALILNQIYALTSDFGTDGDDKIRLIICIEEAQTIFGSAESPAVKDIKQRIQDFRKQGIGLMLLTHNVNDIEVGIRRLCQLKLYLKQAPDTAALASKDLIFGDAEQDDVILKLKLLDSGLGAFSCIIKHNHDKEQQETIFVRTNEYSILRECNKTNPIHEYLSRANLRPAVVIECNMHLMLGEDHEVNAASMKEPYYIRVLYLGEQIEQVRLADIAFRQIRMLEGKEYTLQIVNKKGRLLKEFVVNASVHIHLDIRE